MRPWRTIAQTINAHAEAVEPFGNLATVVAVVLNCRAVAALESPSSTTTRTIISRTFGVKGLFFLHQHSRVSVSPYGGGDLQTSFWLKARTALLAVIFQGCPFGPSRIPE
jgi:hypothetical protein